MKGNLAYFKLNFLLCLRTSFFAPAALPPKSVAPPNAVVAPPKENPPKPAVPVAAAAAAPNPPVANAPNPPVVADASPDPVEPDATPGAAPPLVGLLVFRMEAKGFLEAKAENEDVAKAAEEGGTAGGVAPEAAGAGAGAALGLAAAGSAAEAVAVAPKATLAKGLDLGASVAGPAPVRFTLTILR